MSENTGMMARKILLRCDGGDLPEIGTGHLRRCLLLAAELSRRGAQIVFLTRDTPVATGLLRASGHPVRILPPADADHPEQIAAILGEERPEIVVWDRLDTHAATCRAIKAAGALLVTLDDQGEGQGQADLTINAMVPGGETIYRGLDYSIFPRAAVPARVDRDGPVRRVMLSFGGYDHHDLLTTAMTAVQRLSLGLEIEFHASAIVGARSFHDLRAQAARTPAIRLHEAPPDFSRILAASDVAVLSGGLTLVEALSYGIPCLAVAQYDHQVHTIRELEKKGAVINLGLAEELTAETLAVAIRDLLGDAACRTRLSRNAIKAAPVGGLTAVADLAGIVDHATWDTEFFGFRMAYLHPRRINEEIARFALGKCREHAVDFMYYLCDCHDAASVATAEKHGFHFVDIRLTFERDLSTAVSAAAVDERPGRLFALRPAAEADIAAMSAIATKSYGDSRYFFDRGFSREICEKFYADWAAKSVRGYADHVIVAARAATLLGYITCRRRNPVSGFIELVGVAPGAEGQGVGRALIDAACGWFAGCGITSVDVVTQGRNYRAQRLYQASGFRTQKTELWYHKWLTPAPPGGAGKVR